MLAMEALAKALLLVITLINRNLWVNQWVLAVSV
jgi:hypothetical protein